MTLVEAIQSGQPFRPVGDNKFYTHFEGVLHGIGGIQRGVSDQDLSGDWEIQEKELTVTGDFLSKVIAKYTDAKSVDAIIKELNLSVSKAAVDISLDPKVGP